MLSGPHRKCPLRWAWHHKNPDGTFHSAWLPLELQGVDFDFHLRRIELAGMIAYKADRPTQNSYDWRIFGVTATFTRLMSLIDATGSFDTA